jgi:hypothetical protein
VPEIRLPCLVARRDQENQAARQVTSGPLVFIPEVVARGQRSDSSITWPEQEPGERAGPESGPGPERGLRHRIRRNRLHKPNRRTKRSTSSRGTS